MKKKLLLLVITAAVMSAVFADDGWFGSNTDKIASVQRNLEFKAFSLYPVPIPQYFLERKTISDWTLRWDKPDIVCYSYFFIGSTCIGYFLTHGKPASSQSYLLPETYVLGDRQTVDVDGTNGTNNPGYRFFLANGTAVECSGAMVSCVYADAPLSIICQQIKTISK